MGGGSSREKRKLQREAKLQRQAEKAASISHHASAEAKQTSNNPNDSNALVRLRRKLERKASGKFKLASVDKPRAQEKQPQKRKSTEHTVSNKRPKKNGVQDDRKSPDKRYENIRNKPPIKKAKKSEGAKSKPKHLNRKVAQLSKSLDGGGSIADLEAQMNLLKEQIELMKGMKNGGVVTDEDMKTKDCEEKKNADTIENKEEIKTKSTGSSSDSDDDSSTLHKNVNRPAEAIAKSESGSSSSSGKTSESESEDEAMEESNTRSRGKRRRGRREKATDPEEENTKSNEGKSSETETTTMKTPKKDDTRHCIGRKPVTDYSVGNKYTGQVKYIKSTLGAFIDIGSHSDAFCHISCISDGYATTVEEVVHVGDEVEVRVIEVNREKKRITVSLRSDEMAQMEVEKLQKKRMPSKKTGHSRLGSSEKNTSHVVFENNDTEVKDADVETYSNTNSNRWEHTVEKKLDVSNGVKGADLKRERKLARRAERRAQMAAE